MPLLKLSDIYQSRYTAPELANEFQHRIGPQALFLPEDILIVYECLKQVNIRQLKMDKKMIADYCTRITKVYLPFIQEDGVSYFLLLFFDIKRLPIYEKLRLENKAKADLLEIDALVSHYHELPFIKRYNEEPQTPRNHRDAMYLEFYRRTLAKRKEVLDYLLQKCEEISYKNSKPKTDYDENFRSSQTWKEMEVHQDWPYTEVVLGHKHWHYGINWERLDYRRINTVKNKYRYFRFTSNAHHGYTKAFKKEILEKFSQAKALQLLSETITKVKRLPVLRKRTKIFQSLKSLYKKREWYGFYALALPQIEGIFAEMVTIVHPDKSTSGALPEKVRFIRPYSGDGDYYFDYYEFYLPEWRNRFAHTGQDDEIKIKCAFLVLDLVHITDVFEELDSPLLQVTNILQFGTLYFDHVGKFSRFIDLCRTVRVKGQLPEIEAQLHQFVYHTLVSEFNFGSFLQNLQLDFDNAIKVFEEHVIISVVMNRSKPLNIFKMAPQELNQRVSDVEEALNDDLKILFQEELKLLFDTQSFITGFPSTFPQLEKSIKDEISVFATRNRSKLETIRILKRVKVDLPEEYMISRAKLLHVIK